MVYRFIWKTVLIENSFKPEIWRRHFLEVCFEVGSSNIHLRCNFVPLERLLLLASYGTTTEQ